MRARASGEQVPKADRQMWPDQAPNSTRSSEDMRVWSLDKTMMILTALLSRVMRSLLKLVIRHPSPITALDRSK
jgi:hypothetical protein